MSVDADDRDVADADREGSSLLSETLAQYSAMMMVKHRGEDRMRPSLRFTVAGYLGGRAVGGYELPLIRVETQNWISYQKGLLAMYLLQQRMGTDRVNQALRNLLTRYKFKGAPYPRSSDLEALRADASTKEDQDLITDLFERVILYDLKVTGPTAVRRADGTWDVTVPLEARKYSVDKGARGNGDAPLRIHEVGFFTAEPGLDSFDAKNVIIMEPRRIGSGTQVLKFVTDRRPTHAGIDLYNYHIDRNSGDNVLPVVDPG